MAIKHLRLEPAVRANLDARVASLETAVESISHDVRGVETAVEAIGTRLDREFSRIREAIQPKYSTWIGLASILVALLCALGTAAYVPVWITTRNINDKAQAALDWQTQYIRGAIPSARVDAELAALKEHSAEVEAQFKGVSKDVETQIKNNGDDNARQDKDLEVARLRIIELEKESAAVKAQLSDRYEYLWPQVQELQKRIYSTKP